MIVTLDINFYVFHFSYLIIYQFNDLIIDDDGNFKYLIINLNGGKFNFFNSKDFLEIPWDCVKKIGARTIILDADDDIVKKVKL